MKELSKWKYLRNFLLDRLKSPARHPEFILYFILIIIGFGSIGVYISQLSKIFFKGNYLA